MEGLDRVIVAPGAGVFRPTPDLVGSVGIRIDAGQIIGHLRSGGASTPVASSFSGVSGDVLAWCDERVRQYQPLLWLEAG